MRDLNKVIEITETKVIEKTLTTEEIATYSVNKSAKTISVDVKQKSSDSETTVTEIYDFGGDDYLENPTENDLWKIIDRKRRG